MSAKPIPKHEPVCEPKAEPCEMVAPSGYYLPLEEATLDVGQKKFLYVRGTVCVESSCCGASSWEYVTVKGPLHNCQKPIIDETEKREIIRILSLRYPNAHIQFQ